MKIIYRKVLALLLGMLGVSSCVMKVMYGTPYADYNISGKVKQPSGAPIVGAKVVIGQVSDTGTYNSGLSVFDTLSTDRDGRYVFNRDEWPATHLRIIAMDTDGDLNGGTFKRDSIDITDIQFEGKSGSWYSGKLTLTDVDITLKKEE
ncbi:MAG: radical SAM-associated putative lipoprotein [Bacteroidales bacterium]|nr:radical SAM-associated putative lipoprotein [Bacteroidales bacterium]MDD3201112.1 radical SAM-associated putative lipoprotein [Bacteroidales bacterium]